MAPMARLEIGPVLRVGSAGCLAQLSASFGRCYRDVPASRAGPNREGADDAARSGSLRPLGA